MTQNETPRKFSTFTILWLGQLVSVIGSGLTGFALGVWLFERTGSATQIALVGLFSVLPRIVLSPLAGSIVDRWNRRRLMIASDAGAGLCTLALVLLLAAGKLQVWHIYLISGLSAAFGTVQWPAYTATTTLLVDKTQLGRANGMIQFGRAAAEILAPSLAGMLVRIIGLEGVILIDFATFGFAVFTLLPVRFPALPKTAADDQAPGSFWNEMTFGWTYISTRPGLRGLLSAFVVINFLWGMVGALIVPMILGFTTSDALGFIISIAGMGMLAGSLAMSIWGGPRRRINGILGFEFISGLCFMLIGLRPSFWPTAIGAFCAHVTIAIVFGSSQAIWQSKIEPGVQGRVFAAQHMIGGAASPLAYLLAGPLADRIFGPLLVANGPLAGSIGRIVGAGPGRGIGLFFIVMGVCKMVITLVGYTNPRVRLVEDELPDAIAG
ncbi:MAG: MFS transporter [Anaerolineae bacterium]|nr:MFS transporter [Anaerolineae bacterium]